MKIKMKTIPTRITTYFQREVCSRRKTHTYNYHKRKWNKKVTSNGCYFFVLVQLLSLWWYSISLFSWFSLVLAVHWEQPPHLSNKIPQIQKIYARYKRIILSFLTFLADFSGSEGKKKHCIKKGLLRSIYSRLPVTRTLYIPNLPLTQSNFHFPSNSFLYNFTLDNSNSQQLELFSVSL